MKVKFNGEESDLVDLVGGGPQGTLLGQLEYLVYSNDNADMVSPNDRYKYIDDLYSTSYLSIRTSERVQL